MQEEEKKGNDDQQPIDHLPSDHHTKDDDIIEVSDPSISKPKPKISTPTDSATKKKNHVPKDSKKHPPPDPGALPGTLITCYASPPTIKSQSSSLYPKGFWGFGDDNKQFYIRNSDSVTTKTSTSNLTCYSAPPASPVGPKDPNPPETQDSNEGEKGDDESEESEVSLPYSMTCNPHEVTMWAFMCL